MPARALGLPNVPGIPILSLKTASEKKTLRVLSLCGAVSVAAQALPNVPGISILRLLRTFRVLRIFARLRSLRMIVNSLTASIVPARPPLPCMHIHTHSAPSA